MKDNSKQGFIDQDLRNIITIITKKNYKTTPSCSGRIVLLKISKIGQKTKQNDCINRTRRQIRKRYTQLFKKKKTTFPARTSNTSYKLSISRTSK